MSDTKTDLEREFIKFESVCNQLADELVGHGLSPGKADNFRSIIGMINLISRDPISPEEKVKNIVAMYTDEISIFGKISGRIEKLVNQLHHQLKSEKTIVKSLIKYSESERVKARELRIKYLVKTIKREHKHILNININLNILIEELKKHVQELSNENKIPDNEKDITENFVEKINSIGKKGYEVLQRIYSYHKDAKKYLKNLSEGDVFN